MRLLLTRGGEEFLPSPSPGATLRSEEVDVLVHTARVLLTVRHRNGLARGSGRHWAVPLHQGPCGPLLCRCYPHSWHHHHSWCYHHSWWRLGRGDMDQPISERALVSMGHELIAVEIFHDFKWSSCSGVYRLSVSTSSNPDPICQLGGLENSGFNCTLPV